MTLLGPLAEERKVHLRLEADRGLPTPTADGRRLQRALENLVRNAIEFANEEVVLRVRCSASGLMFEVLDDGPGFPSEMEPLEASELAQLRSRADSAGLGLTFAERVAKAHGASFQLLNR